MTWNNICARCEKHHTLFWRSLLGPHAHLQLLDAPVQLSVQLLFRTLEYTVTLVCQKALITTSLMKTFHTDQLCGTTSIALLRWLLFGVGIVSRFFFFLLLLSRFLLFFLCCRHFRCRRKTFILDTLLVAQRGVWCFCCLHVFCRGYRRDLEVEGKTRTFAKWYWLRFVRLRWFSLKSCTVLGEKIESEGVVSASPEGLLRSGTAGVNVCEINTNIYIVTLTWNESQCNTNTQITSLGESTYLNFRLSKLGDFSRQTPF